LYLARFHWESGLDDEALLGGRPVEIVVGETDPAAVATLLAESHPAVPMPRVIAALSRISRRRRPWR